MAVVLEVASTLGRGSESWVARLEGSFGVDSHYPRGSPDIISYSGMSTFLWRTWLIYILVSCFCHDRNRRRCGRTSLVVQWLRFRLPMQGVKVQSLDRELRCHVL